MILFLYNLALLAGLVVSAPWWLWRMATTRKYREGLPERLGLLRRTFARLAASADGRPVIWIHAVSLGEVLAVRALVAELDRALPGYRILVSTTTRTGQASARGWFGQERVFYCPLDLPWAVRAYLEALKPRMLVLAETEFWPNLLHGCFRRGIPVVVVNARISDRSWPRYWRLRGLWRPFLSRLTRVLAQSEADAERLRALGCDPGRVVVNGNLKFDVRSGEEMAATRILREIALDVRLLVAGSTHAGEEEILLAAWPELLKAEPNLAMVIAPRHEERLDAVAELLHRSGYPWRRRSGYPWRGDAARIQSSLSLVPGEIVMLDSSGELASVYSLAAVAFVGGSLVAAGGHNPLEPAQFGAPVVMGEHYVNFRAIVEALLAVDALRIVSPAGLATMIGALLSDPVRAGEMGARGRRVFEAQAGATARTVTAIEEILAARVRD
jgi:3-deoxy-D-manno-octulosonic-acid transferase